MSGDQGQPGHQGAHLAMPDGAGCECVQLHFTDVAGAVKSVVIPTGQLSAALQRGHWFDGSALDGSARRIETDLLLRPDAGTWGVLPWLGARGEHTGRLLCDVLTPEGTPFPADPRAVLRRTVADVAELGLGGHVASEVEFFLFRPTTSGGAIRSGLGGGATTLRQPLDRGGSLELAPAADNWVRHEMLQALEALGVPVAGGHRELGPGQHQIELPLLPAVTAADAIVTCKFVVRTVARRRGLVATFMPKPMADAAGSGLRLKQVLLDTAGDDVLTDPAAAHGLSPSGRAFVAGQLTHARAMCAVLAPTVNSYKRFAGGGNPPLHLAWGHTNPAAVLRVPRTRRRAPTVAQAPPISRGPSVPHEPTSWVELRCPDPSCNPYLAIAVALAAGMDGVRSRLALPPPVEPASTDEAAPAEEDREVLPRSLGEALVELDRDGVVRDALGAPVYERLSLAKEQEWLAYRRQVSSWELGRYFESSEASPGKRDHR